MAGTGQDVVRVVTELQRILRAQRSALDCADAAAEFIRRLFRANSATVNLMDYEQQQYQTITNVGELSTGESHHPAAEFYSFDSFPATTQQLLRGGAYRASLGDPHCQPEHLRILRSHHKHACMGAPIRIHGRPLGELWLTRSGVDDFTENDADLAVACGATIARHLAKLPPMAA